MNLRDALMAEVDALIRMGQEALEAGDNEIATMFAIAGAARLQAIRSLDRMEQVVQG